MKIAVVLLSLIKLRSVMHFLEFILRNKESEVKFQAKLQQPSFVVLVICTKGCFFHLSPAHHAAILEKP